MELLIIYLVFAALPGAIAHARGRSFWGVFLAGLLLSPLIGLVIALLLTPDPAAVQARIDARERTKAGTPTPPAASSYHSPKSATATGIPPLAIVIGLIVLALLVVMIFGGR